MTELSSFFNWYESVKLENFREKSILIIGNGFMANEYCKILKFLRCQNVVILGNSKESTEKLATEYDFQYIYGGFEKKINEIEKKDLVIICTPIHLLLKATKSALLSGQKNILVEKPGSIYPEELLRLNEQISDQNVRIAFNRLFYPSLLKLKKLLANEVITSCHFRFTEWIDTINFQKYQKDVYTRWGISNSLHVVGMVFDLIDSPQQISCFQEGSLDWHPSGSIFTGGGITSKNILFSYHSDWESFGRWSIEIFTKKNIYRLMPLEELHGYNNKSHTWEKIETESYFPKLKPGLGEQILMMLSNDISIKNHLMSLSKTVSLINTAEKIFAYK